MTAGKTYQALATVSPSGTALITFSSIPATYTDLRIVVAGAVAAGSQNFWVQFNNDTATNYSRTALSGDGASAASMRESSVNSIYIERYSYLTTGQSVHTVDVMNYANTTTYKTLLARGSNAGVGTSLIAGLWRSTSAITEIDLIISSSTFATGSTATLYGIASA